MKPTVLYRWGIKWNLKNKLDGVTGYFMFSDYKILQFFTKREAKQWVKENYSYIATRKDLRQEPFGWRMPKVIKIKITISEV